MEAKRLHDRWAEFCGGIDLWSRRFWAVGVALTIVGGLAAALVHRLFNAYEVTLEASTIAFLMVFLAALPDPVLKRLFGPPSGRATKAWIRYAARCVALLVLLALGKGVATGMALDLFALVG